MQEEDLVKRLKKQEETERLKNILTQLTNEMRAKYPVENSEIPSQDLSLRGNKQRHHETMSASEKEKELHNKILLDNNFQAPQKEEEVFYFSSIPQTPAQQHSSSNVAVSTPLAFAPTARKLSVDEHDDQEKGQKKGQEKGPNTARSLTAVAVEEVEKDAVTKSSLPSEAGGGVINSNSSNSSSLLRNQVEAFRQRQQEALRGVVDEPSAHVPDFTCAPSPPVKQRPPDVVMPSLQHEPVILPDAFNVMSTAQRKMQMMDTTSETNRGQILSMPQLSEGPLTTTDDDAISEHSAAMLVETSKSSDGKSEAKSNQALENNDEDELEPVRDLPDATVAAPGVGVGHQRVPKALHMRFQAELHQMESIEEAERQLNQLNRLRDVATARNDAVTAANFAQVYIDITLDIKMFCLGFTL